MEIQLTEREALDLQGVCALARLGGLAVKDRNHGDKDYCSYIESLMQVATCLEKRLALAIETEAKTHG
jgi:hypothetical protein|nr:MAG TPA: hypothetical protein [Caudoviricetes sp.]